MSRRSIASVAQRVAKEERARQGELLKSRDANIQAILKGDPAKGGGKLSRAQFDSFVNFAQRMGIGADNALSTAGYGFNPITRIRQNLEWMHRGSWLAGVVVDSVADDMTRMGVEILGDMKPDDMAKVHEDADTLGIMSQINDTIKWSRLYGGCIAAMMIDGQDMKTPLRLETVGKNQFRGLLVLDRWMVEPTLNDLVTQAGPDLGLPKYYRVTADAPALPRIMVHHSRCIRLEGIRLPYWQRVQENLWGLSVLERLYDRMIAFDSATTGAAQLVYKAYIRTYKVKDMRQIVAQGGPALAGLIAQVDFMRRFQGQEGITLMDSEDEFEGKEQNSFQGLDAALTQFAQQLSGAAEIPLVRLFGQSPHGFNGGETDVRNYYDMIKQRQMRHLKVPLTKVYRCVAQSAGIKVPDGFGLGFPSLWQLTDTEKADIAEKVQRAVQGAEEAGHITQKVAMEELRQSSRTTGIFTNITDEDINAAEDKVLPPPPPVVPGAEGAGLPGEDDDIDDDPDTRPGKPKKVKAADSAPPSPPVSHTTINVGGASIVAPAPAEPGVTNVSVQPAAVTVTPPNVVVNNTVQPADVSVQPPTVNVVNNVSAETPDVHVTVGATHVTASLQEGDKVSTTTRSADGTMTTHTKQVRK
jgi:phage-related protein (TIGR01555 family)